APKLNGIHVGFPYVTQFIMERNAKRLTEAAAQAAAQAKSAADPAKPPASTATDPSPKVVDESEALLN
ncbi:MAG TPA: hypothetical protein VH165_26255, partial [Kofleriaceae bacterium]|nr:hypothetical protein [Kofleriaceae bacterium]